MLNEAEAASPAEGAIVARIALDGGVRPIKGALAMAMAAAERGIAKLLVPAENAREATVVEAISVFGVEVRHPARR